MMRCARFGLFLYLFTVPWTLVFFSWSGHDYARILQVGVAGLAGLALLWEGWRGWSPRLSPWGLALLVTGLLAAGLSIAQAPEPVWAWREAGLFAGMVCIAALIGLDDRVHLQGVVQAAALAFAAYVSLEFLVINLGLTQGVAIPSMDFALGYDNPRFFNHVTTVALPLCLAAALQGDDLPWRRRLAAWGLIGGLALTFWSGGRAVLVAQAAGLLVAAAALGLQRARPLLRVALVGALWAVALYLLQFILLPWVLHLSSEFVWTARVQDGASMAARGYLWQLAWRDWLQAPWLGLGPMHYAHIPNPEAAHPHNIYLQVLAEWGAVVFLATLLGVLAGLSGFIRALRSSAGQAPGLVWFGACLLGGWVAFLVDGCFSGNLVMPTSQVWIAFLCGAVWRWCRASAAPMAGGTMSGRWIVIAAGWGCSLLSLWLVWNSLPDTLHLNAVLDAAGQRSISSHANPRFWSMGWF